MKKGLIYFFALALAVFFLILSLVSSAPPMENLGNKTFIAGDSFSFGDDYNLYVNSLDAGAKKANLILTKGTSTIFQKWFSEGALLNEPGVITAHVYSIKQSNAGGDTTLTLTDIMAIGKTPTNGSEPTTGNPINCTENWVCSLWKACANGIQTRNCTDINNCGTTDNQPALNKTCYVQPLPQTDCTENWVCTQWSDCINNLFTRTCIDNNGCGTVNNKPQVSLACNPNNPGNPNAPSDSNIPSGQSNPGGSTRGGQGTTNGVNNSYEIIIINQSAPTINFPFWKDFEPESIISLIYLLILFLILFLLYVYISSAFTSIAKKGELSHPGISWIPIIGPLIIASKMAKMHWWPMLLLIFLALKITPLIFLPLPFLVTILLEYAATAALLILFVFSFIWMWKTFVAVNRPGWWALFNIIPILGNIIFLALLGVAAWGSKNLPAKEQAKNSKEDSKQKKK